NPSQPASFLDRLDIGSEFALAAPSQDHSFTYRIGESQVRSNTGFHAVIEFVLDDLEREAIGATSSEQDMVVDRSTDDGVEDGLWNARKIDALIAVAGMGTNRRILLRKQRPDDRQETLRAHRWIERRPKDRQQPALIIPVRARRTEFGRLGSCKCIL